MINYQKNKVLRYLVSHKSYEYPIRLSREENEFGIDPGRFLQIIEHFQEKGFLKINKRSSNIKVMVVEMNISADEFLEAGGFSGARESIWNKAKRLWNRFETAFKNSYLAIYIYLIAKIAVWIYFPELADYLEWLERFFLK